MKMRKLIFNKRGSTSELLMDNIIFIILTVLFLSLFLVVVYKQRDNVVAWEEYYAAELSRILNMAKPGDVIEFDVQKATEIAVDKSVPVESIFSFDNEKNRIYVKLSPSGKSYYEFFNEVDVSAEIISGHETGVNILKIEISEGAG